MHMKKGAFTSTSTGYGRHQHKHNNNNNSNKSGNSGRQASLSKNQKSIKSDKQEDKPPLDDLNNDLNSGFGQYLRSDEGVEMMKLFVFANTVLLIVTQAWPHIQQQYIWFRQWWEESFAKETIE
ncbi:uncharacterized protein LOC119639373 [Glossina fuscipes]|uniref:Uncharacterized protein LOC119639373 n=2 Tax=Nemorhina TaxID=44051 RepID=A0A9C5Z5Y0_9MUSC|nr:uncharacterized protein LOC119639373 [Glossina fuscipes]